VPRSLTLSLLLALFFYLSLYTWNLRTGYLDALASNTGLVFVTWALIPGKWVSTKVGGAWDRYVHLVNVSRRNDELETELELSRSELARYKEEAAEVQRLRTLMSFSPPASWGIVGARVLTHRLGPNSALDTVIVDKGYRAGVAVNLPVVTSQGVVGRTMRVGPWSSALLLLTDPNSRISVMGQKGRTAGILAGRGPDAPLEALYVPLNEPLEKGEVLITSGRAGIFPKGLPVARVIEVGPSDLSLFQSVQAELLVDLTRLEEVLLLSRREETGPSAAPNNATGVETGAAGG